MHPSRALQLGMSLHAHVDDELCISTTTAMAHNDSFESTTSTVAPSTRDASPRRSPARRAIRKSTSPREVFSNGSIRVASRSIDASNPKRVDVLTSIIQCMDRFEKTRSPISQTMQIVRLEQEAYEARRHADSVASLGRTSAFANSCKNCGETKFEANDERYMVCSSCGACNGRAEANASLGFEAVARGDLPVATFGQRAARTAISAKTLQSAHKTVTNQASKSFQASQLGYQDNDDSSAANVKKRDKILSKIHKMLGSAADGPVCVVAMDIANRFFQRAVAHSVLCKDPHCFSHLHNATVASIACESVCHAIDGLLGKLSYENSHPTVEASVVLDTQRLIEKSLSDYEKHQNVSQSMKLAFYKILTMSRAQLSTPCAQKPLEVVRPIGEFEVPNEADNLPDIEGQMRRLRVSLQSIGSLGWADAIAIEASQAFCSSPEGYEWCKTVTGWNADLVALMMATAASAGGDNAEITARLKKKASSERVAWESTQEPMSALTFLIARGGKVSPAGSAP